jgi:hypothetical protein
MRAKHLRVTAAAAAIAAALAACGGGEIVAIVSFVGSAGGDWVVDDPNVAGFQRRSDCGEFGNEDCVVNIQISGVRSLYSTDFDVTYTGNLPGCPVGGGADPAKAGTISGQRISLPGCFTGQYVTINEALSDDRSIRAFFDSEVPNLTEGVWVEIQNEQRRFKFEGNPFVRDTTVIAGCELTSPATTPLSITVVAADRDGGQLQTEITDFSVGGATWTGRFEGISAMRLTRGSEVLELQRRDLPGAC